MNKISVVIVILLLAASIFIIFSTIQLSETKAELLITQSELDLSNIDLNTTKDKLDGTQEELLSANSQIDSMQVELDNAKEDIQTQSKQLADIEAKLSSTESQLESVNDRLDLAENENKQMFDDYANLWDEIFLRQGQDTDCQAFITPDNPEVTAIVSKYTGIRSADTSQVWYHYKRLYDWVVNNIEYSSDSRTPILPVTISGDIIWRQEFWRMPAETIEDGVGDCEDMAVLLVSLLDCYNQGKYSMWCIEIANEDTAHVAVAFPVVGDQLTILDPAGHYYTNQWGILSSSDVRNSVNDWLSHWRIKMPGAKVVTVFSNNIFKEFSSTDEFIQWVLDR